MVFQNAKTAGYDAGNGSTLSNADAFQDNLYNRGTEPQLSLPNQPWGQRWADDLLWQPTKFGRTGSIGAAAGKK